MIELKKATPKDTFWHNCFQEYALDIDKHCPKPYDAFGKPANRFSVLADKANKEFCVYLIGPMSQKPNMNVEKFYNCKRQIESFGIRAITPHEMIDANTSWIDALTQSLECIRDATCVVCVEEFTETNKSYGSTIEQAACFATNTLLFTKYIQFIELLDLFSCERERAVDFL